MAQAEKVERATKSTRSGGAGSTGRPRSEEAHKAILDATLALLVEVGFPALTVGRGPAGGRGKATIYRRWPSKLPLVVEAFGQLPASSGFGSLETDLKETLKTYLANFNSTSLGRSSRASRRTGSQPGAVEAARARGPRAPRALRADLRARA